ncbi:M16 family metallopeptidase [Thermodesulfitimonas autotrophica]|uniref:M16 family metallopeptidase n=1 Tax=Thermodesulfitimonas autotrophica TaxID=1894989 RepID=UPI002FDFB305
MTTITAEEGEMLIRTEELPNGVTVLTEEIPHVRSVAIGVWVDVGSRDEAPEQNGISHFIEHALFKGTSTRTAKQIAEELDAVGGQLNAFTAKEYTCFHARVLDEHFRLAVDLLTDMLFNSRFDPADLEREKNVIIEEIKMYEDAPDELVHDVFTGTLWQGHPLGRPIVGTEEVVKSLGREDLLRFYERHYLQGRMVVSVAGNIRHEEALAAITPAFERVRGNGEARLLASPAPHAEITHRLRDTEQVHLCIGTPGVALGDDLSYIFQTLNTILGGGMSSRLFQRIREDRGLVYSVYSYHSSYRDTGLFCIYAGLAAPNVSQTLEMIAAEIASVRRRGISEEEFLRAKNQLKGNFLLSLESVVARMSRMGKSQLYLGRVVPPEEVVAKIEAVTLEDVFAVAESFFRPENFALASIGPWEDGMVWREALGRLN